MKTKSTKKNVPSLPLLPHYWGNKGNKGTGKKRRKKIEKKTRAVQQEEGNKAYSCCDNASERLHLISIICSIKAGCVNTKSKATLMKETGTLYRKQTMLIVIILRIWTMPQTSFL